MKKQTKTKINKDQINVIVNSELYPLEAIYGACYVFLDKAYLRLSGDPKKEINVSIKPKEKEGKKKLEEISGDFLNELLNYSLRCKISSNNRKIREYIIGKALYSSLPQGSIIEKKEEGKKEDWEKDELGITTPWEEKYEK